MVVTPDYKGIGSRSKETVRRPTVLIHIVDHRVTPIAGIESIPISAEAKYQPTIVALESRHTKAARTMRDSLLVDCSEHGQLFWSDHS